MNVLDRLVARTEIDNTTGCWIWTGFTNEKGYGRMWVAGKLQRVHRLSWLEHGHQIGQGERLDHLCRNRACWNPAHLEPVTNRENILRGEGPTAANARKTHCAHGHALVEGNIRQRGGDRAHHRECLTCRRAARKS